MKRVVWLGLFGVMVLTLLFGVVPVGHADVKITLESETVAGEQSQKTTIVQYYTPTKMRNEYGGSSVSVIDLEKGWMLTLMPSIKKYLKQTIEELKEMVGANQTSWSNAKAEKTGEKATINGFECEKIIMHITSLEHETTTEYWMTKGAKGLAAFNVFQKAMAEAFKGLPSVGADTEAKLQLAAEGYFPIRTVMRQAGPTGDIVTTVTVTAIEEGEIDATLFEIPEDYTEQSFH